MIICPNCNHQNPDGSMQCENCYTPLPQTTTCPNCGASVQTDATFCGQCGFNLQVEMSKPVMDISENLELSSGLTYTEDTESLKSIPTETISPALQNPWDDDEDNPMITPQKTTPREEKATEEKESKQSEFNFPSPWDDVEESEEELEELPDLSESEELIDLVNSMESSTSSDSVETESVEELLTSRPSLTEELENLVHQEEVKSRLSMPSPEPRTVAPQPQPSNPMVSGLSAATQLQLQNAKLLHVQTNIVLEIPANLSVVHIGKPNSQIPPDIDVSGLGNSDIVSRIHADIRVEGDAYFIEDVGSSNGTYINHSPLLVGNRHRLRSGDRISLGKGDLITFIFQLSE